MTTIQADVCIVGAGAAGSVLAEKLARAGKRVVVMEQGTSYALEERAKIIAQKNARLAGDYDIDFNDEWNKDFRNAAPSARGSDGYWYSSLAGVGGTTLHWQACTPRPRAQDLQTRSLYGYGRDWPISYQELEPWLLRAEHELGVAADDDNPYASPRSGPFPMPAHEPSRFERETLGKAAAKLGWTAHSYPWAINSVARDNRPACQKCRHCLQCPTGAKYSADRSHVPRFVAQPGARLMSRTKLVRLETAADGETVIAAHGVRLDDRSEVVVKAARYVLAMGGVETPRMLMLSADSRHHKHGLGNRGGQLGRGFTDHVGVSFWLILKHPVDFIRGFPSVSSDHFRANGARDKHGTFMMLFFPGASGAAPPAMLTAYATQGQTLSLGTLRAAVTRSVGGVIMIETEDAYTLDLDPDNKDAFGNPLPRVTSTITPRERATLDQTVRMLPDLAGAMDADRFDAGWSRQETWWASHPIGATAMARTPEHGVCDTDARVFGLDNLYVAGGSLFPHQGANNPTLTITALSLRLAAHLGAS